MRPLEKLKVYSKEAEESNILCKCLSFEKKYINP